MKRHIPNIVTGLNLLSGCIAILFAVKGQYVGTAIFVFLGIFFDFFDGLLARKLNVQSDLGLQLDSLADVVTSGNTCPWDMCKPCTYRYLPTLAHNVDNTCTNMEQTETSTNILRNAD